MHIRHLMVINATFAALTYAAQISDLQGTWKSGCIANGSSDQKAVVTYDIAGTTLRATSYIYTPEGCSAPTGHIWTDSLVGSIAIDNSGAQSIAGTRLICTVQLYRAVPITDYAINGVNSINYCGYSDWTPGVYKDISGRYDVAANDTNPRAGESRYDLVEVAGDTMYLGNMTGPFPFERTYPTVVSKQVFLLKSSATIARRQNGVFRYDNHAREIDRDGSRYDLMGRQLRTGRTGHKPMLTIVKQSSTGHTVLDLRN